MTTAKEAVAFDEKPRLSGSHDGGPRTEAILFKAASICTRAPSTVSADRIITSMSLFNRLQLKAKRLQREQEQKGLRRTNLNSSLNFIPSKNPEPNSRSM